MPDIFENLAADWHRTEHGVADALRHLMHPHQHAQAPAAQPVNLATAAAAAPPQEEPMSLVTLENDVKNDLTDGLAYVEGMVARLKAAAPGIIETTEAVGNSTVGKLAEKLVGSFIPPGVEPVLVGLVEDFVRRYGQPAQAAAPAEPAAPATAQ